MFNFHYKTDEELELAYKHLTPGPARFMVRNIKDKDDRGYQLMTATGHPKLDIELLVVDSTGVKGLVKEVLSANASWKVKEFLVALGVPQFYSESGAFDPNMLITLHGTCTLMDRSFTKSDGTSGVTTSVQEYLAGPVVPPEKLLELQQIAATRSSQFAMPQAVPPQPAQAMQSKLHDDIPF